jgi:hypothetical protein
LGSEEVSTPIEYEVKLRCVGNHPWHPQQRLKKLLKIASRMLGMECRSAKEIKPAAPPTNEKAQPRVTTAERESDAP